MAADKVLRRAREVLLIEKEAIEDVSQSLDDGLRKAIELIYSCRGKVVVTGMGKVGIIGKKIAATLASTGTPAVSLHPAEAVHGDVGIVTRNDVVLAISNSGETEEVLRLIPIIRKIGAKLVSMTGDPRSRLAKMSDVVLNVSVRREACPMGLVPTASTTATLAVGDALAMVLLDKRGFREKEYAIYHSGGELGKKLGRKSKIPLTPPLLKGARRIKEGVQRKGQGRKG